MIKNNLQYFPIEGLKIISNISASRLEIISNI